MTRYWMIVGLLLVVFLALFLVVEALQVPLLTDPRPYLQGHAAVAALTGVGLLLVDVLLPVPSSLVMVAHGALFGVVVGTLLSLLGSTGATLIAFGLGRSSTALLSRLVTPAVQQQAARVLRRWGPLASVVTRPLPLLAEAVAVLAGTSGMTWGQVAVAAVLGSLPVALLYALLGAAAIQGLSVAWVFLAVAVTAGGFWWIDRRIGGGESRG